MKIARTLVQVTELPAHAGWDVTWTPPTVEGDREVFPTAADALATIREREALVIEDQTADVAIARIEWSPCTRIGRLVVQVLTDVEVDPASPRVTSQYRLVPQD